MTFNLTSWRESWEFCTPNLYLFRLSGRPLKVTTSEHKTVNLLNLLMICWTNTMALVRKLLEKTDDKLHQEEKLVKFKIEASLDVVAKRSSWKPLIVFHLKALDQHQCIVRPSSQVWMLDKSNCGSLFLSARKVPYTRTLNVRELEHTFQTFSGTPLSLHNSTPDS